MSTPEEGQLCDCCDELATKELSGATSKWCAGWFIGMYCDQCFEGIEREMEKECKRNEK